MDSSHPSWSEATTVCGVGTPTITTSTAMPITPPSWRALDTTADAVANCPPGTAAIAALPSTGRTAPAPMPLSTCPGSHWVRNAGSSPAREVYQA